MGEGVEPRHWRPANVDESCLAHPVAMDTARSSMHVCACLCEREKERERGLGKRRRGGRGEINQQAGVEASQSGSERAAESRVEGEGPKEGECMWVQEEREDRKAGREVEKTQLRVQRSAG